MTTLTHVILGGFVTLLYWLTVYDFCYYVLAPWLSWKYISRILASFHAIIVVIYSLVIIYFGHFSMNEDYDFPRYRMIFHVININNITMSYLFIDMLFHLTNNRKLDSRYKLDLSMLMHHIVGCTCMIGFIVVQCNQTEIQLNDYIGSRVYYNSLYYSLTEISTPFLHIGMSLNEIKQQMTKPDYEMNLTDSSTYIFPSLDLYIKLFAIFTWITFLLVRILGSFPLIYWIITYGFNYYYNIANGYTIVFFIISGNTIIIMLNYYWFCKITLGIYRKMKSKKYQ